MFDNQNVNIDNITRVVPQNYGSKYPIEKKAGKSYKSIKKNINKIVFNAKEEPLQTSGLERNVLAFSIASKYLTILLIFFINSFLNKHFRLFDAVLNYSLF